MTHQGRDHDGGNAHHGAGPGRTTLTAPAGRDAPPPGKQTLTMALPIQRKADGADASPRKAPAAATPATGGGQPLPDALRARMEGVLGAGLSAVRVHEGPQAQAAGARAYAQGTDLFFAPGQYDPESKQGQELIGHELTHVVQQARGGVQPTKQAGSLAVNDSSALERDADEQGAKAAGAPAGGEHGAQPLAPIQAMRGPAAQLNGPTDAEKKQAATLTTELQTLIDHATWKEVRKTAYPKESKAGIQRAKERKDGKRPDLSGLGQIKSLEHFAGAIKKLQGGWAKLSPDARVAGVGKAIDDEFAAQKIPVLMSVKPQKSEFKGSFQAGAWRFNLSEDLVKNSPLSDADAAELCNTGLHEARHAEQAFLAARFAAGPPSNHTAAEIAAEQGIPQDPIAKAAVAQKFDGKTDATVASLGKQMYGANVTDGNKNQRISDDDFLPEMAAKRDEAKRALQVLTAAITATTLASATTKRDELKAAIAEVERRYTLYRNIPYEADAHEVGDAAEQAFKGWP